MFVYCIAYIVCRERNFLDIDTRLRGDDKVDLWKFVAIFGGVG